MKTDAVPKHRSTIICEKQSLREPLKLNNLEIKRNTSPSDNPENALHKPRVRNRGSERRAVIILVVGY